MTTHRPCIGETADCENPIVAAEEPDRRSQSRSTPNADSGGNRLLVLLLSLSLTLDRSVTVVVVRRITIYSSDTPFPPSVVPRQQRRCSLPPLPFRQGQGQARVYTRTYAYIYGIRCVYVYVRACMCMRAAHVTKADDGPTGKYLQEVKQKGIPGGP